ncbi:MAG: nitroreductase family deazaflavin-dependent oxidoreductase [Halieaceae bacterium]
MAENPMSPGEYKFTRIFIRVFAKLNVAVYRLSGGRLWKSAFGRPICLVKMTGAKSGKIRWTPVMYVPWKDGVIIVASLGGAPKNPVWYYNLVAHPQVEVLVNGKTTALTARQVYGEERMAVWPTCVEHYPDYADYQARTDREIPVFICE